ncbi:Cell morphogenesis protein PAG1 [Psilocybe cubensis]|uniref:Cell morphogenesis protein PAG1 n=2 Tax=Psilocybe cubensis TaxID=181762 RepID=A0ACB8GQU3_PSICU|nr:Cell morphogenesis protein PAG1 [Psilocybe cubensis]KAH9477954.1 Cell morphogenesis protein PAG1 [Psilocybe cubensis]
MEANQDYSVERILEIYKNLVRNTEFVPREAVPSTNATYNALLSEVAEYNDGGKWFIKLCDESATLAEPLILQRKEPEAKVLGLLLDSLIAFYQTWDPIPANAMSHSVLEFINGVLLEQDPNILDMELSTAAKSWPYFLRRKTGISAAFAFGIFPKELNIELPVYIQAIEDTVQFIDIFNDVLSFHKEYQSGERNNYINSRARVNEKTIVETLQESAEDALAAYSRAKQILMGTEAYLPWKSCLDGYISFHFLAQKRYRLNELGFQTDGSFQDRKYAQERAILGVIHVYHVAIVDNAEQRRIGAHVAVSMSNGLQQITIPDFDDDVSSAPTPFGRSAFGLGNGGFGGGGFGGGGFGGGSGFGGGLDSPNGLNTPMSAFQNAEKSYFSHARGDSSASIDSTGSATTRYASKPGTPFSHSAQPSIATNTVGFSKKPSFASIRNAFKKSNNEPPPMPSLEHSPYPVLKNPFNRSTSSLTQPTLSRGSSATPTTASNPSYARPGTPGSSTNPFARHPTKSKGGHAYNKSQHSHNGSIFHISDNGSDPSQPYPPSPPPVPRVPSAYGLMYREDITQDYEDDKVVMDPKTPSDFALHAVFIRFVTSAEGKIDSFLRQPLDQETLLTTIMGPGVDPKFDETLHSLGIIAQKNAKKVIDSIMRWRRSQLESVGSDLIRVHQDSRFRFHEIPNLLNERKALAAIYVMCRALIAVLQMLSKDALGDSLGHILETTTFEQFKRPDRKLQTLSANHRINSELYATLLGHLANVRFMSVTDLFLAELTPVANGQVSKDLGAKYENLIRGLSHIKIKVWPPEAFEEGAEFMELLSKSYANSHGHLKVAFAETLILLLHPIGKTAQAETNNPQWGKAIELIYPKAKEMMSKPRYWQVVYPLAVTSLCVAPQAYFLKHWQAFFEASISKLKERPYRTTIMNGLIRIAWTYLYRCQESASTTMTKLETLLKHFFPPNRTNVFPADDHTESLVYIMHFILSRHPEYGRDICLDLMQQPNIASLEQKSSSIGSVLAPERIAIALNAILLSFHNTERDINIPTWPSSSDFSTLPPRSDYVSSSEYINTSTLKPGMAEFIRKCSKALSSIAAFCYNSVGNMSVFDEQWSYVRLSPAFEESNNFVIRRHADGIVTAYPVQSSPHVSLLCTSFQAWPRLLDTQSLAITDAIEMLLRGVVHVEPNVSDSAGRALKRFMADDTNAIQIISQFNQFLYSPGRICHDPGLKLHIEYSPLLRLWVEVVDDWIKGIVRRGIDAFSQVDQIVQKCTEIEAASLFLLSHDSPDIYAAGVKIVRFLGTISPLISNIASSSSSNNLYVVDRLQGRRPGLAFLKGHEELLDNSEKSRLEQWQKLKADEVALRIADSINPKDRKIWRHVYPSFLQECIEHASPTLGLLRDAIVATVSRYHPSISYLGGVSNRVPPGLPQRNPLDRDGNKLVMDNKPLIDQWHIWVKILCSTAVPPDVSRPALTKLGRDHSRVPSADVNFERERYLSSRGLFRHLTPFLDSEYTLFRDAAVLCISSFPPDSYPQLLEALSPLTGRQAYEDPRSKLVTTPALEQSFGLLASRQMHDENRSKSGSSTLLTEHSRRQERLHSAVARIYCLTSHMLHQQRSSAVLANILKFVRNTQTFLSGTDTRDNPSLHRLRRYFCGIVERLFNELATLKDSDRFIPSHMHISLYRLCEEWCQVGPPTESFKKRLNAMQRTVEAGDPNTARERLQKFRQDSASLSHAAVGALTALSYKAFFPPDQAASSPTDRLLPDFIRPLTVANVLDRLSAIMTSSDDANRVKGMNTLRALSTHPELNLDLIHEILRRSIVVTDKADSNNQRFFEVVSDIVCEDHHRFTFSQIVCLGLTNLRHPSGPIRSLAFSMLEAIHHQHSGLLTMSMFEASVASMAPSTYVHAHKSVADFLAGEHPHQAISILAQLGNWLPQLPGEAHDTDVILLLLQSLEFWIPNINLMTDDISAVSREGLSCLYHLTSLTLRYGQSHAEQILVLWTKLVESPQHSNSHATVRFLLEQAHKVGNMVFITCAANIVASLCQTRPGREVFEDLCSVIEPAHMLPTVDHKVQFPEPQDLKLWEDLDVLFGEHPRVTLGSAQYAWLFLSDVALQRYWEMKTQLPVLLHSVFTHLDHRVPFIRERAHSMLFQLLRSWTPGYDELPDRSTSRSRVSVKEAISVLEKDARDMYWVEESSSEEAVPKMKLLCSRVLGFLEPLAPSLVSQWGSLALTWGTTCSIRATAFRSLQLFRALMPRVKKADFAMLLGRLSNTVAASEENIQAFTSEMFFTINAVAKSGDLDKSLLPQAFWCACACLSTTVENEFKQTIIYLESLLSRIDLNDAATVELLISHRPKDWQSSPYLQPPLLRGLRSSVVSESTIKVLSMLAKVQDGQLIDPSEGRLRDLYTVSLPWCLHAMDQPENTWKTFAEDIGALASKEKRHSIFKIMTSFAKGHFRTRDDFLRQSVASLREHYGHQDWTKVVTLLLGLVLNEQRWLRVHAMQVLKVLFQHRETRNPVELLGSELLMPLLRLLETDLAPQALDVLEEPMAMSGGGPAAKHVLRMSMHVGTLTAMAESESVTTIFGAPEPSGWCVAQADSLRKTCQRNVMAVFDTCSVPTRPSRIEFEPEVEALASIKTPLAEDLGGLMKNLHDLNNYFNDANSSKLNGSTIPTRRLEARVAAILAKSANPDSVTDTPQTPFLDVFSVGGIDHNEDSDEYSDSDSDTDAFIFDNLPHHRAHNNGARHNYH